MTTCQCPLASYCETHQRQMTARQHAQCRDEPGMFAAFHATPRPSLGARAKTFAAAAKRATRACGGRVLVSAEIRRQRQEACTGCPKEETDALLGLKWCGVCGCALGAKQRLATETCPLGRWPTSQSVPTPEP